jgi:predicted RecA/RadA family phage recombinase
MKNFIQKSFSFDILAPKQLMSGVPFILGGFVAIPVGDASLGELVTVYTEGVFALNVSVQVNIGDVVYLHADGTLNTTPQSGTPCGFCMETSTGGVVKVMLNKSISMPTIVDLSAYFKTNDFNATLIKACGDAAVKTALQAAVKQV